MPTVYQEFNEMVGNKIWFHPDFNAIARNICQNATKVLNYRVGITSGLAILGIRWFEYMV